MIKVGSRFQEPISEVKEIFKLFLAKKKLKDTWLYITKHFGNKNSFNWPTTAAVLTERYNDIFFIRIYLPWTDLEVRHIARETFSGVSLIQTELLVSHKVFGPVKPFLDHLYLKTEKCTRSKLLVWREPPFIFRICDLNSSVLARFEILQWLYGPEKFPGLSRNGPQVSHTDHQISQIWR